MLIDLHGHSSGISRCCQIPAPEVLKAAKDAGLDGIVLSNHYQKVYIPDGDYAALPKDTWKNFAMLKNVPRKLGARCFWELKLQWRNIIWPICLCTALMKSL